MTRLTHDWIPSDSIPIPGSLIPGAWQTPLMMMEINITRLSFFSVNPTSNSKLAYHEGKTSHPAYRCNCYQLQVVFHCGNNQNPNKNQWLWQVHHKKSEDYRRAPVQCTHHGTNRRRGLIIFGTPLANHTEQAEGRLSVCWATASNLVVPCSTLHCVVLVRAVSLPQAHTFHNASYSRFTPTVFARSIANWPPIDSFNEKTQSTRKSSLGSGSSRASHFLLLRVDAFRRSRTSRSMAFHNRSPTSLSESLPDTPVPCR
mmetsp:Transcript_22567/g.46057  ORF Transcript_22567/g.46057 Transcript_22567/m.46057 type:complete len:258 (-) Transcript_22567:239-1012(-)